MKHPSDDNSLFYIDVIDPIVQESFDMYGCDELQSTLENSLIDSPRLNLTMCTDMSEVLAQLDTRGTLLAGGPILLISEEKKTSSFYSAGTRD